MERELTQEVYTRFMDVIKKSKTEINEEITGFINWPGHLPKPVSAIGHERIHNGVIGANEGVIHSYKYVVKDSVSGYLTALAEFQTDAPSKIDKLFTDVMAADTESGKKVDNQIIKVATYQDSINQLFLTLRPADGTTDLYPPDVIIKNLETLEDRVSASNLWTMYEHYSADEKWLEIAKKDSWTEQEAHMLALIYMDLDLKGQEKLLNAMLINEGTVEYHNFVGEDSPYTKWTVNQEKVNMLTGYLDMYIQGTVNEYSTLAGMTTEQLRERYGNLSDEELRAEREAELGEIKTITRELKQRNEIFLLLNNLETHKQPLNNVLQNLYESGFNDQEWTGVLGEPGDETPIKLNKIPDTEGYKYMVEYRGSNAQSVEITVNPTMPGYLIPDDVKDNIGTYLDSTITSQGGNIATKVRTAGNAGYKTLVNQAIDKGLVGKIAGKTIAFTPTVIFALYDSAQAGYQESLKKMDVDLAKDLMNNSVIVNKFNLEFNTVVNNKGLGTIDISIAPETAIVIDNWNKWVELRHNNVDSLKLTPEKLLSDPYWVEEIYNNRSYMSIDDRDKIFNSNGALVIEGNDLIPVDRSN